MRGYILILLKGKNEQAKIVIRIDDVCPQMDRERFDRTVRHIESCGVRGLLGIVPDCRDEYLCQMLGDPDFWEKLIELREKGWTLAMHGYTHVYDIQFKSMVSVGLNSEFAGHSYKEQFDKLKKGRDLLNLHGIKTDIFFAPSHSYDKNTLYALRALGFKYISDGRSTYCYRRYGLKFIPCRFYGMPRQIKGVITLALHPCAINDLEYEPWKEYIENHRECLVSYSKLLLEKEHGLLSQLVDEKLYVFFSRYIRPWLWPFLSKAKQFALQNRNK